MSKKKEWSMLAPMMLRHENKKQITEDIYDDAQREEMLDEDEITASENAFMQGREQATEKKAGKKQKTSHEDSVSVELEKTNIKKTSPKPSRLLKSND